MATETIEGPARPIRCVVSRGRTVITGNEMIPVGQLDANGARSFISNPNKFTFGPGEEVDLAPADFAHMHAAGFVQPSTSSRSAASCRLTVTLASKLWRLTARSR